MRHQRVAKPRGRLGRPSRRTTATAVISGIKSAASGLCVHVTQFAGDKGLLEGGSGLGPLLGRQSTWVKSQTNPATKTVYMRREESCFLVCLFFMAPGAW
jgi:hypothetical protein